MADLSFTTLRVCPDYDAGTDSRLNDDRQGIFPSFAIVSSLILSLYPDSMLFHLTAANAAFLL